MKKVFYGLLLLIAVLFLVSACNFTDANKQIQHLDFCGVSLDYPSDWNVSEKDCDIIGTDTACSWGIDKINSSILNADVAVICFVYWNSNITDNGNTYEEIMAWGLNGMRKRIEDGEITQYGLKSEKFAECYGQGKDFECSLDGVKFLGHIFVGINNGKTYQVMYLKNENCSFENEVTSILQSIKLN